MKKECYKINEVEYIVEGNKLINVICDAGAPVIEIPDFITEIDLKALDSFKTEIGNVFGRRIKKLSMSGITSIEPKTFVNLKVEEFVWPSKCTVIPKACFMFADIISITNLENVEEIKPSAFSGSNIKSIHWPEKCKVIPANCFSFSRLKSIYNTQNVEEIHAQAFYDCPLSHIDSVDNVIDIKKSAFAKSKISSLDLRNVSMTPLELEELENFSGIKIIKPYYCD